MMAAKTLSDMKQEFIETTQDAAQFNENEANDAEASLGDVFHNGTKKCEKTAKEQQTEEPYEMESESLTVDVLDDLTLPGDMDANDEQHSRRWKITDDGCADWALEKIKAEKDELDRLTALAEQKIAELKEKVETAKRRYEQNTTFLTNMLERYFDTVEHKRTKTGTESYRLLNGQLVRKPSTAKMQPDDEKLVAWLRDNGRDDLIKVETKAAWGELKKQITIVGEIAMIEETGEIVEGINIVDVPAAFSVKF